MPGYWHASQSGSFTEHAGASAAETVNGATALSRPSVPRSVDFYTWVADDELR
jgi:hypothetical protein